MSDAAEEREIPATWREYLKESGETARVCGWVWKELISPASRRRTKRLIVWALLLTLIQMIQPWITSHIFNSLITRQSSVILAAFGGLFVCLVAQRFARWRQQTHSEWISGENMGVIDHVITDRFFEKSGGQHIEEGSLLNVANIDKGRWRVVNIQQMLLFEGVLTLATLVMAFLLLFILSPVSGLIMVLVLLLHLAYSIFLNQRVVRECTPIDTDFRALNRRRVERWEKIERVKTNGKESEELAEMDRRWEGLLARDRRFWFWLIRAAQGRGLANNGGLLLIMAYGAWLVWSQQWLVGALYPLYMWASRVSENIWRLSQLEYQLNWNMPSVRSMMEAVTIEPDVTWSPGAPVLCHQSPVSLVFRGVSYTYPHGSSQNGSRGKMPQPVIRDVNFEVPPGKKVALIGDSGAGKTTIMRLALGYMYPDDGFIQVNGYKLRELNLSSWIRLVGYIPQQAQVFDGSVRYNLTYGLTDRERKEVTDDRLWELMRLLQVDFQGRLVDGLDTVVGRNGVKLSGGEAQRLMIGAAAVKEPLFMIIDEATSSLDSTTERAVQRGLTEVLKGDVSALVIAHRLSTVRHLCDKFLVLCSTVNLAGGESQIEASASSFEELYEASPTFRRLATDQGVPIG